MSGHSQFKNIMYRKGAQDAKKARVFAKLAREITVAAKSGLPEPDKNPRLRYIMFLNCECPDICKSTQKIFIHALL